MATSPDPTPALTGVLAGAERQLTALLQHAPVGMAVVRGEELRFAFANPACHALPGRVGDTLVGRAVEEVFPGLPAAAVDALRDVLRTRRGTRLQELEVARVPDAERSWWDVEYVPLSDHGGAPDDVLFVARDVSERVLGRQLLQAALLERERQTREAEEARQTLDALMEYVPEGITIADAPDVRIRCVSRFGRELTGRSAGEIEGIAATGDAHSRNWGLYHPDGATPAQDAELPLTRAVVQGAVITDEEWVLRRPDGSDVTILCNAGPIRGEGGITGGIIAWRDITARKVAEAAYRESEERFRSLADLSPDAILVTADGAAIAYANAAAARIVGAASVQDLLGATVFDFAAPEFHEQIRTRLARVLRERQTVPSLEGRWQRFDGATAFVEVTAAPIEWCGQAAAQIVARDVTERRHAELELRTQREFLQRLVDAIPVMVTIYDPAVRNITVNREFQRVLGWSTQELRARDVMETCYPDPAYREGVRAFMQRADGGWRDFSVTARDGSQVQTTWANIRLTDERQVGIGIDISERKRAEEQVRHAYAEAQRAVRDRDAVLAVVSHDLRNPLNTIAMAASLLLEDLPEEKKQAQAGIIRRAVDQMARLINDLLDASRIEGGGLRVLRDTCAATELLYATRDFHLPLAESRSIALTIGEMAEVDVLADRDRVLQALANLVTNAVRFTPEGGSIVLACSAEADVVRFSVSDTGSGVEPEHVPHLFDRFWQASRHHRAGAGLGLAIAHGIVAAHGGHMRVDSEPGRGSTFSFTLPRASLG
jgi:PAS domain S-box-containing protein